MNEPTLNCGRNGDVLCAVRNKQNSCPYYDHEDCSYFVPDGNSKQPEGLKLHRKAQTLKIVADAYLSGDFEDKEFCAMVMAAAFDLMQITPRQAQAMINTIKMDIVVKQLENMDTDAIIASLKETQES